jgi:KDO2-lipid IV(A) lauroyltransferase
MTRALIGLLWLLHFLPLGALAAFGNGLGRVLYWLIPERRRVTRINLAKCFPQMAPQARERLARAHFRVFIRSLVEHGLLWWAPRARIERLIRIEGLEHVRALRGTPVILFVPHFVGLDAGATRLICELDVVGIYARQKDPRFTALLLHGRGRFGNQRLVSRSAP